MFSAILEFLRSLPPGVMIAVVLLIPAAETGLVVGLVLPGELAVVTAGILAAQSHVPLVPVMAAAVAGSILGDSIGYLVGRHFQGWIKHHLPGPRWKRAQNSLRRSGPVAVFLARFTPFVRSLMPPVAAAARLPYSRFLPWSVAAGVLWGSSSVLLGYFFARNAEKILNWSIGGFVLIAAMIGGGIFLATRHRRARRRSARSRAASH
jgi:membrane-associated protein